MEPPVPNPAPIAMAEIRILPIRVLQPAPYNPRKQLAPDDPAYRKLEASLRQFGLVEPLIWNRRSGHVVGGHTRLRILQSLKVEEVPVAVVELSDVQEKALNIVLNNHEAQGRYDTRKLSNLLNELAPLPEMTLTGFSTSDMKTMAFEPSRDAPAVTSEKTVRIILEMLEGVYPQIGPLLDPILADTRIACHVQRRT
jgi:ParB-like chromosome segregation protein Spo0J